MSVLILRLFLSFFSYLWSGCLVVIGIYLSTYNKATNKPPSKAEDIEVLDYDKNLQIV